MLLLLLSSPSFCPLLIATLPFAHRCLAPLLALLSLLLMCSRSSVPGMEGRKGEIAGLAINISISKVDAVIGCTFCCRFTVGGAQVQRMMMMMMVMA